MFPHLGKGRHFLFLFVVHIIDYINKEIKNEDILLFLQNKTNDEYVRL